MQVPKMQTAYYSFCWWWIVWQFYIRCNKVTGTMLGNTLLREIYCYWLWWLKYYYYLPQQTQHSHTGQMVYLKSGNEIKNLVERFQIEKKKNAKKQLLANEIYMDIRTLKHLYGKGNFMRETLCQNVVFSYIPYYFF